MNENGEIIEVTRKITNFIPRLKPRESTVLVHLRRALDVAGPDIKSTIANLLASIEHQEAA